MDKSAYIVGAGTYSEAMFELAEILGYNVKGFYDDDEKKLNTFVMNTRVLGRFSDLSEKDINGHHYIVAIGNNKIRQDIMERINILGGYTPTLIHPKAIVSSSSIIGKGVYIQANVYIWTKAKIDDFSIISPSVVIAHHSKIGKACLVSTLSGIGASISIRDRVMIGIGATVMTGVHVIGEDPIVGAGAVVIKDLPSNCVAVGNPARILKKS